MKITTKKLTDLHSPARNVRKHSEKQIEEYVRSVTMFGQIRPLVVDEAGEILAGNGLFMALQKMGAEECACYVMAGMTEAQKKKLMLADNRVYELGITDMDAFEEIIKDLDGDIDVPGWDDDLLAMMNAAAADVDDVVNSYGSFGEGDVGRIADRPSAVTGSTQPAAPAPATAPAVETAPTGQDGAEVQRYIVCPKCGERICL